MEVQTVCLCTTIPCYLLMPLVKEGPVARMLANSVANVANLCRNGLPWEGLLDNTQNEFQSYNGGDMTCYRHLLIDVKDKVTKKYHPIRFYMMNTDVPRINKAPRIKRQVASIDKKSDFRVKSGPFRTSSPHTGSSSQKKQKLSLQERSLFQVQQHTISRMPKYKERKGVME